MFTRVQLAQQLITGRRYTATYTTDVYKRTDLVTDFNTSTVRTTAATTSKILTPHPHPLKKYLTLWRPLLPYGYSYKASCARPC